MKVSFFIIGAQKCGTSALHKFLTQHPQILGGKQKEIDFFSYENEYKKGLKYYHKNFKNSLLQTLLKKQFYLDSSPSYLLDQEPNITCERLYNYNSKAKLIVLIRNPIDRAFSAYQMYKKRVLSGNDDWWFEWSQNNGRDVSAVKKRQKSDYKCFYNFINSELDAIEQEVDIESRVLKNSLYDRGLKFYQEVFGKQLLVIQNERMQENTPETLSEVAHFLNLNSFDWGMFSDKKIFKGEYSEEIDESSLLILKNYFRHTNQFLNEEFNINYL